MSILTLDKVWVNLTNTGQSISGYSNVGKSQTFSIEGRVATYASGRRRSIATTGERGTLPFTLRAVSLTTRDGLRTWLGRNVQVRDTRGQKWFGVFTNVDVSEYKESTLYDVSITLELTTTVEGV